MKKPHKTYYTINTQYSNFLDSQNKEDFRKYIDYVAKYLDKKGSFLDIGCGTGITLELLKKKNVYGIEISKTSVAIAKKKKLQVKYYNGDKIPFKNNTFSIVGSYNVLEHVDNPLAFLDENLRVLKENGYLVIACPNFLSVTNDYHYHTRGIVRKIKNFLLTVSFFIQSKPQFLTMKPVVKKEFTVDDDAVNVTNPMSIMKWAKTKNLKKIYWSSNLIYAAGLKNTLDKPLFNPFLGSSFFIFKKDA
jgi:SAM-dependent methyltransferase